MHVGSGALGEQVDYTVCAVGSDSCGSTHVLYIRTCILFLSVVYFLL